MLSGSTLLRHLAQFYCAIYTTVHNAQCFLKIQQEFGSFDVYVWGFVNHQTIDHAFEQLNDYPSRSTQSDALAKDLKKRGFKFMGSTTCYAYMQAVGMVNDHVASCFKRA